MAFGVKDHCVCHCSCHIQAHTSAGYCSLREDTVGTEHGIQATDGFLGKTNNFAHPALKELVIKFFYMGSYRIVDKCPNQFCKSVPLISVVLAGAVLNCVLDRFAKNRVSMLKMIPQFLGKEYWSTFQAMVKMLNKVPCHPYHGQKLRKQLDQWVQEGWLVCGNRYVIINYNMTTATNVETRAALHQVDMDVE
ncbi:hypothetical protein JVU11DRAFT_11523 [Chiua virens]|nr:hypothetical protein JVU11DRAFT_11523 [Chiua virens]